MCMQLLHMTPHIVTCIIAASVQRRIREWVQPFVRLNECSVTHIPLDAAESMQFAINMRAHLTAGAHYHNDIMHLNSVGQVCDLCMLATALYMASV
jgi:hypothetical protein